MNSEMGSLEENRRELSVTGMRATNQRSIILEVIRHGQGHLDADEIYRQARIKQPHISLSTVYRALQSFKKLGLVDEHDFGDAHHRYEIKPAFEHQHLICLGCGKVVEFECPLSPKMKEDIARENDFEVTGVEVRMTGYCPQCRQDRT
jgi:Fur family ferric uptake transcriptional regulator